jgi:hypothetical protein
VSHEVKNDWIRMVHGIRIAMRWQRRNSAGLLYRSGAALRGPMP